MSEAAGISIVIPVLNEEGNLEPLYQDIVKALEPLGRPYEIVFVDDGSTDGSCDVLRKLVAADPRHEAILFRGNYGKSAALMAGFDRARYPLILTMDADLQDDPSEVSKLLSRMEEGYDMVTGWKKVRHDPWLKVVTSRLFNRVTSSVTGIHLHDYNSGFKLYRAEALRELDIYGELHRFIPALLGQNHWKIAEVAVNHRPRHSGRTKYGLERFLNGFLDLMTVRFLTSYLKSPLHLFGRIGGVFFGAGFVINCYITWLRLTTGTIQQRYPLLFLGVLFIIVGVQLVCTGLLAEMVGKMNSRQVKRFHVREICSARKGESGTIEPIRRERVTVS